MSNVLVNFSGHVLCKETLNILNKQYDMILNADSIDVDFSSEIESQIELIVTRIPCVLDGSVALTIIPPGQSTFSILLVSYLHGMIGHFPNLCYLELKDNGLYLPKIEYEINTQKVRSSGRMFRNKLFKVN